MKFKNELAKRLVKISNIDEMQEVLTILFTDSELEELEKRGKILKLLLDGKTQRVVADKLAVGIATVTRGANEIKSMKNPSWWTSWLWR